jgi:hypothetical protein
MYIVAISAEMQAEYKLSKCVLKMNTVAVQPLIDAVTGENT